MLAVVARVVAPESSPVTVVSVERAIRDGAGWFTDLEPMSPAALGRIDDRIRNCGSDDSCTTKTIAEAGASRLVLAVANLTADPPIVTMKLVDCASGGRIAGEVIELRDLSTLDRELEGAIKRLLQSADHTLGAMLRVRTTPADAELAFVPPSIRSKSELVLVPAAEVKVIAAREGYEEDDVVVNAIAGQIHDVELELSTSTVLTSWWLWTIVGVAVAGAGAATIYAATRDPGHCYPARTGGCD